MENQSPVRSPSPHESPFENVDIQQPELRIPSPQPPLWLRFWQPIGTAVMDTRVLKEPRGFMRILEWFFAIIAFALCCDFATNVSWTLECKGAKEPFKYDVTYPFRLDHIPAQNASCGDNWKLMYPSGDMSSDAQFFVFTGVISFLGTMATLGFYVFFSDAYANESKRAPMVDFVFTVIVAVFWLSASAAWANGVINMKYAVDPDKWIFEKGGLCEQKDGNYLYPDVTCTPEHSGEFKKANVSIIVGFLNCFLWTANLWFLYKETAWFSGGSQQPEQMAS